MTRKVDVGSGLVVAGAVLLLVSLFLDWFGPLSGWTVFEALDLVLLACAGAALAGAGAALRPDLAPFSKALPVVAAVALVVVLVQAIDPPPAGQGLDREAGLWLALAASVLLAVGAMLATAQITISLDVEERDRRRRMAAVDGREGAATGKGSAATGPDAPTQATTTGPRREGGLLDDPDATRPLPPDERRSPGS
jgi:hypothetical protein